MCSKPILWKFSEKCLTWWNDVIFWIHFLMFQDSNNKTVVSLFPNFKENYGSRRDLAHEQDWSNIFFGISWMFLWNFYKLMLEINSKLRGQYLSSYSRRRNLKILNLMCKRGNSLNCWVSRQWANDLKVIKFFLF